jgi:hypothetical protein
MVPIYILKFEPDEFADAQAGVEAQRNQSVVARIVRHGVERLFFGLGEEFGQWVFRSCRRIIFLFQASKLTIPL